MQQSDEFDIVEVPKQYYLGFRPKSDFDTITYPTVFACPFDKDDAAFKKRRKTCDDWANVNDPDVSPENTGKGVFIDNVPQTQFKIAGWGSRYSTDNKVFDIHDPRGFTLEIYAKNLIELISQTTVVNGVIQDECIWTRRAGVNVLLPTSDKNYKVAAVSKELTMKDVKIGDSVLIGGSNLIYVGPRYVIALNPNKTAETHWVPTGYPIPEWYNERADLKNRYIMCTPTYPCTWSATKLKDKYHVFYDSERGKDHVTLYTSPKIKGIVGHGNDIDVTEICTTHAQWKEGARFQSDGKILLLNTKEELNTYDTTEILSKQPARIVSYYNNCIEKEEYYQKSHFYRNPPIIDRNYILTDFDKEQLKKNER